MEKPSLVPVGKIVTTHGVRGAVKVQAYGDTLGELEPGDKVLYAARGGAEGELTLVSLRPHKRVWIGEFEEIRDMDKAREFVGRDLLIPEDQLPELPEGEYYHFQLLGLSVETTDGRKLGILRNILETGSNDVYVVDREGEELLVPAIEDVIREIDLDAKKVIVDLPEGLEIE